MSLVRRRPSGYQLALFALLAGAAVALLPRIALTFYAFPSTDDYCIVAETRDDGFWYMQVHSYLTWTGRYSAVFLESIISQFDLIAGYPWVALLTLLLTLAAIRALTATVIGNGLSSTRVTAIALAAAAVFIDGLPSTVEAFYWMPGAASYQWGIITYLFWLSLLIRRFRQRDAHERSIWQGAAILLLTVAVPGFNEVSAPIVLATIGAFVVADRRRGGSDRFLVMMLGIAVLLTAFCFAAPGNANRSSGYPALASRHNLPFALIETARQTARFIVSFGSSPALWVGGLAAWWCGARVFAGRFKWLGRPAYVAAVVLCLISVLALTLFPLYWEYGEANYSGEGRTYNVTYLALCGLVLTVTAVAARAMSGTTGAWLANADARREWIALGASALLAAMLIASPSTRQVYEALREAPAYVQEERARARVLRTAPPEGVVFVDKITITPAGLFWGDLGPDETHWINVCVAKYYRLASVRSRL